MRYRVLDPLRGLAALWVFLYHYDFSVGFQNAHPWLHEWLKFGGRGVPMFFVISGFCITASALSSQRRGESPGKFLTRRAMRIYPTFWCSIVVILALNTMRFVSKALYEGTALSWHQSLVHYDAVDWLQVITLTRIFDQSDPLFWGRFNQLNGAYWTLAIEFQFYVVVALAFLRPRWFVPILGAVTAASLVVYPAPLAINQTGVFLAFWAWFACGVGLAFLFKNGITPHRVFGRSAVPVASLTIAALVIGYATFILLEPERLYDTYVGKSLPANFQWYESGLFTVLFTVALWMGHAIDHAIGDRQLPSGKLWLPARWSTQLVFTLGAMSYSLYLMHNEISMLIRKAMPFGGRAHDIAVIAATCAAIYPFYRYCEVPFLRLSSRKPELPVEQPHQTDILPFSTPQLAARPKSAAPAEKSRRAA